MDTNGTRLSSDASFVVLELERVKPNVVILCFALDQPRSLSRISSYWLPAISSATSAINPSWPFIPVCLCGTKADVTLSDSNPTITNEWLLTRRFVRESLITAHLLENGQNEYSTEEDELANALTLQTKTIEDILTAYKCIQTHAFVSGYYWAHHIQKPINQIESNRGPIDDIPLLWLRASSIVLQPVFPLFSETTIKDMGVVDLTRAAKVALKRIFRIIDTDCDNLVSIDELSVFQTFCFGHRLEESELVAYVTQKRDTEIDSVRAIGSGPIDALNENASLGLTLSGFTSLFLDHVLHMNSDPDPSAWQILHAFGYSWNPISLKRSTQNVTSTLCLQIPEAFITLPPLPTEDFLSTGYFSSFFSPSISLNNPKKRLLQLSGTRLACSSSYGDKSVFLNSSARLLSLLCSRPFQGTGLGFLACIFKRYISLSGLTVLSYNDLEDIFSICSSGQPFGPLFPISAVTREDTGGGLSLHSWIHSWQALIACKPHVALKTLYEIGFSVSSIGFNNKARSDSSSIDNGFLTIRLDPRIALEWGNPRIQTHTSSISSSSSSSSAIRKIVVVGSSKCGKTTLIRHFLNGSKSLDSAVMTIPKFSIQELEYKGDEESESESDQIFGCAAAVSQTYCSCLFPELNSDTALFLPVTLAITELGKFDDKDKNEKENEKKKTHKNEDDLYDVYDDDDDDDDDRLKEADAILIVANPAQQSSIDFVKKIANRIPDGIPVAVASVVFQTSSTSTTSYIDIEKGNFKLDLVSENQLNEGIAALSKLCRKTISNGKEKEEIPKTILSGLLSLFFGWSKTVTTPSSLCIEYFPFSPYDTEANSMAIFEYVNALTIFPKKNNPMTAKRRQNINKTKRNNFFLKSGFIITSIALLYLIIKRRKI